MTLMRTYTIVVEPDQDGGYFVTVPALPGCFTRGSTIEEWEQGRLRPYRACATVTATIDASDFHEPGTPKRPADTHPA
jgi:hypothetical protein